MSDDGAEGDAAVNLARSAGRLIVDATGNGTPTRWERISARLRLSRPLPAMILRHPTFTTGRKGAGSIVTQFERAGPSANSYPICEIGFYDEADRPRPIAARIDCEILEADEDRPWATTGDAIDALARVGRILLHGEAESLGTDAQGMAAIVLGDASRVNTIQSVCKLAMSAADLDNEATIVIAHPAPGVPVSIRLHGDTFVLADALDRIIKGLLNRHHQILRVETESDDSIRVMRCYTSVTRGPVTPVEAVTALRDLERHFMATGIRVADILPHRS